MAISNVFVVTEQPPLLGRIRSQDAGAQIRKFMAERQKYQRRHRKEKEQLPILDQLMEDEDLKQLRVVMTARLAEKTENDSRRNTRGARRRKQTLTKRMMMKKMMTRRRSENYRRS